MSLIGRPFQAVLWADEALDGLERPSYEALGIRPLCYRNPNNSAAAGGPMLSDGGLKLLWRWSWWQ
jgi:hypothetical protein